MFLFVAQLATQTSVGELAFKKTWPVLWANLAYVACNVAKGWPHEIDTIARNVACDVASCGRALKRNVTDRNTNMRKYK